MPFTWDSLPPSARRLPVMAATAGVLALLGPFGTYLAMPFSARLLYWGGCILMGWLCFEALLAVTLRRRTALSGTGASGLPALLIPPVLGVAAIMTGVVAALESTLGRSDYASAAGIATLYLYCLVITALVSALPLWLALRTPSPPPAPSEPAAVAPPPTPPREPPFLARIPARLGRRLLALEMEDHYVRIHTAEGSDLLLLRLRDAMAELDDYPGQQVHRSYWVAADAVAGVERRPDGKLTLVLSNGLRVPVSRSHAAAIKAAGWLDRSMA